MSNRTCVTSQNQVKLCARFRNRKGETSINAPTTNSVEITRTPNRGLNSVPQLLAALLIMLTGAAAIASGPDGTEAAPVTASARGPRITAAPGFSARLVVPPGELYDPLQMVPSGDQVLVNDDGGKEDKGGGRLVAVDSMGAVTVVVGPKKMLPDVGMDVATEAFGPFGGQVFLLTQPAAGKKGLWANHLIAHINPDTHRARGFLHASTGG